MNVPVHYVLNKFVHPGGISPSLESELAIFIILRVLECVVRRDDKKKLRTLYEEAEREAQKNPLEF